MAEINSHWFKRTVHDGTIHNKYRKYETPSSPRCHLCLAKTSRAICHAAAKNTDSCDGTFCRRRHVIIKLLLKPGPPRPFRRQSVNLDIIHIISI